jgi:hypothetical protein
LRIFAADFGVKRCGRSRQPLLRFAVKKIFTASSMRYMRFSERAPIRTLDAGWFFAALPRVRARLAELRAARFATLHIVNHQQSQSPANSRTTCEAAQAREAFTAWRPHAVLHSRGFHQRIGG